MSSIRPEVLALVRAAQTLISAEEAARPLPLSDDETDKIIECVTRLNKLLQDGEGYPDGDGHP